MNKEFFGVVALDHPSASELRTLGQGQVGTLRIILSWPTVEPTRGQRTWTRYDALVERAALNGIRVMPTIFGSPAFAASSPVAPPGRHAKPAFAQFVQDAVARYGNGGTFWQLYSAKYPGSPPLPVANWQLWNESSSPSYWSSRPSGKEYAKLVKLAASRIRGQDPGAWIVLGGLFIRPTLKRAVPLEKYVDDLYKVNKIKKFFDAVAVHPYATNPKDALKGVQLMRTVLERNNDAKTPVWITEMGWATSGDATPFTVDQGRQASNLAHVYSALLKNRNKFKVAGVIWYGLRDSTAASEWLYRTGLFEEGGSPKPAWFSMLGFTGGTYDATAPPVPPGTSPPPPPPPCPLPPIFC